MFYPKASIYLLGLFFFLTCQTVSAATSPVAAEIAEQLYAGNTSRAAEVAQAQLAAAPDDDPTRFALGIVQFLQAVEHLGQQLYRHGLKNQFEDQVGLSGLPILRLPVPVNPEPAALTYDQFQGVLAAFVADLDRAEKTLGAITSEDIDLQMHMGRVRLDMDGDGRVSENDYVWMALSAITGVGRPDEVDFDASDVPWLQAYCHLLMSVAEFPLAYDWHEAFDQTFFNVFAGIDTPLAKGMAAERTAVRTAILKEIEALQAELDAFIADGAAKGLKVERAPGKFADETWPDYGKRLQEEYWGAPLGRFNVRVAEMQRKIASLSPDDVDLYGQIADVIAFVHLNHWPLTDADRMQSVLSHLEAVVGLSRENWRRILAETDDKKEWIPNPEQTGVFREVRVQQRQVEGWHLFLDEFEAVLKGEKLIPHWRFVKGFNLRRFFTEPADFDIVLLVQGSAALPYLEEGEEVSERTWRNIRRLMGGDILRYFVWFN